MKWKQVQRCTLYAVLILGAARGAWAQVAPSAAPVDAKATTEARALLNEIDTISGHATLSGQHNFPNHVSRWSDRVYDLTGKYPALFGQDFGFSGGDDKDSTLGRPAMIAEAIRQYRNGAVVALTWHAVRPSEDEPVTFKDSVQGHLTDWEWQQLLSPGTDLNNRWCRQVDVIAGYLRELQDAGVPVLFRPYHEMNGNWFWWGGRPGPDGSAALYRQLYDRFVHVHHLHNLVWVWNVNAPSGNAGTVADYYPGAGYADVLTMDIYGSFDQAFYDSMLALAGPTRPIALAEVGAMPSLATLAAQPRWAYFMMWSGMAEGSNTPEALEAVFHAPNVINRGDPRLPVPPAASARPPEPGTSGATPEAKALLARLAGKDRVLLGQKDAEGAVAAIEAATGKQPALVSLESTGDPKELVAKATQAAAQGMLVAVRWAPTAPTGASSSSPLTDFEWQQLLKPGSDLNTRWAAQADALAVVLKQLERAKIAVLLSPYPDANSRRCWWGNRPGVEGSQALYRMLYIRLTETAALRNIVWSWAPGLPTRGGDAASAYSDFTDYYPGPLFVDAVTVDAAMLGAGRGPADAIISRFAGGKPFGVAVESGVPAPTMLAHWGWVVLPEAAAASAASQAAMVTLYSDPRSITGPGKPASSPAAP